MQETFVMDQGYAPSGVHWEIHKYKLRYTNLFAVRVNGKEKQFRSKDACYKHLQDSKVTKFRTVFNEGKKEYEQVMLDEQTGSASNDANANTTGGTDGGDGV